ncbi:phosphoglycolate phosphatase [Capsulimonas corticalis]|uniref:Phosphoglycolate phosphatase n=1 Tax=Capsulimonas corticalis TaxID=2219043 RepID=A0A402CQN3_9BACT|nr:HAD family hydrolase [Capsulimonas corticalis]BDI34410.1 phosphoglycolate phosphatase [Capsulimonas corticalis]
MPTTAPVRGVIFDLDGTLADTFPVIFAAFRHAFAVHADRHLSDAEIEAMFGPNEEGCIRKAIPGDWQACLATYLAEYERVHDLCPGPFPGVIALLDWLRARGVLVAIVTGKGAQSAAISLRRLELNGHFEIVKPGSPEGSIKPQAIREVLAEWAMTPADVVYVGDAPSDVTAAREVGVRVIGAAWADSTDAAKLAAMSPDALLKSVGELREWLAGAV